MQCLMSLGLCIALTGLALNIAYGYMLRLKGTAPMRAAGEEHVVDSLMGFATYLALSSLANYGGYVTAILLNNLGIPYIVKDPSSASIVFKNLYSSISSSLTQLYVTEVTLTTLPFISPVGYYLSEVSRYFTWQAQWALTNAYLLYYLSLMSARFNELLALGLSLIPIRQVRWVGGILAALGLVTPMYIVLMGNWTYARGISVAIQPNLANDIKGIVALGTNLFTLGGLLEEFNVVTDVTLALYTSIVYGLSRFIGDIGLILEF